MSSVNVRKNFPEINSLVGPSLQLVLLSVGLTCFLDGHDNYTRDISWRYLYERVLYKFLRKAWMGMKFLQFLMHTKFSQTYLLPTKLLRKLMATKFLRKFLIPRKFSQKYKMYKISRKFYNLQFFNYIIFIHHTFYYCGSMNCERKHWYKYFVKYNIRNDFEINYTFKDLDNTNICAVIFILIYNNISMYRLIQILQRNSSCRRFKPICITFTSYRDICVDTFYVKWLLYKNLFIQIATCIDKNWGNTLLSKRMLCQLTYK